MTYRQELNGVGLSWSALPPFGPLAQANPIEQFFGTMSGQLGSFVPGLIGAFAILIVGLIVATIVKFAVKGLLKRTDIDNRLASMVSGQVGEANIEGWVAGAVYWVVLLFTLIAALNALQLTVVSEPLNNLLNTVLTYLPRIAGAAVILGLTWVIATVAKLLISRGLGRFDLESKLAEQTGVEADGTTVEVNETVGNVVYWFIFLLALPLLLSALQLPGLLGPVEGLINQFLSAIPQILTAAIVFFIGWLVAKIVRGIVTNFLIASGADTMGARFGLAASAGAGTSLSSLAGLLVYVLILIPVAIAALNELDIQAISGPAVNMLQRVMVIIPQVLAAGIVLVVFYLIGRFIADLAVNLLSSLGFDGILTILGLPDLPQPPAPPDSPAEPTVSVQTARKTPSEFVGLIVLVGIVLFGAITATEILGFPALTDIVRAILRVSVRVLSGVLVFAVGLYAANLVFRLVGNMGGGASNTLAQTARIAILAFAGAMALQQMGVATSIVNLAFGLLLGAIAVAIALAFGLGGRDVAAEQLREWIANLKR
jgi:hypothetical protein